MKDGDLTIIQYQNMIWLEELKRLADKALKHRRYLEEVLRMRRNR